MSYFDLENYYLERLYLCTYVCKYVSMYVCIYIRMHVCILHTYVCLYINTCVCVCVCVCVYTYIYIGPSSGRFRMVLTPSTLASKTFKRASLSLCMGVCVASMRVSLSLYGCVSLSLYVCVLHPCVSLSHCVCVCVCVCVASKISMCVCYVCV
jgi:hypothetical protein